VGAPSSCSSAAAGKSDDDASASSAAAAAAAAASSGPVGPARIDRHFFLLQMSQVPKKLIRKLLVHLLSRNASAVMDNAVQERQLKRSESLRQLASAGASSCPALVSPLATPLSSPAMASRGVLPAFPTLKRRRSVVIGGGRRKCGGAEAGCTAEGLRLVLTGQSMLQHDIRTYPSGRACIEAMTPLLAGDVVFTELETSLVRPGQVQSKTRGNSVFFHAAAPEVLDVLMDFGFNLFSAANNHAGDLGLLGLRTLMEEFDARKLVMGGIGLDARQAALPVFFDAPQAQGRVGLVSFASKIPEHSIARDDPPTPGVNSLSMSDMDTFTLNEVEEARVIESIKLAAEGFVHPITGEMHPKADLVCAYHHNHYCQTMQHMRI
jgi:hypothetical protein